MYVLIYCSILFIVTLVFTSIHLHRHRKAGGHSMPGRQNTTTTGASYDSKPVEMQPNNGQQPSYAAQPQYNGQQQQPVYGDQMASA